METHQKESKDTRPSKLDSLPYDLQMAIVTRLPAKSLLKLVCVSKMWSSIIRSRECIDSFYSVSSTQSRFIVAVSNCTFNKPEKRRIFCFSFSDVGKSSSLVPKFEMTIPSETFAAISGYCESLHGFLSVVAGFRHMICNPVTKQVIKFPIHTRFVGYDPIDDQHKALYAQCSYDSDHVEHKVLTLGGGQGWRRIESLPYRAISEGVCINGFVYYGAYSPTRPMNPGVVCFDVRSEKLSYIKAPDDVVFYGGDSIFLEYKGKLASIVRFPYDRVTSFDLWILEDVEKHEWSKQTCVFPLSLWDFVGNDIICFPGTTKTGEIIMHPHYMSLQVRPFYIFYFNVETKTIRRVRLLGIGDNEEFRRCCGIQGIGEIHVRIAPRHVESISRIPI